MEDIREAGRPHGFSGGGEGLESGAIVLESAHLYKVIKCCDTGIGAKPRVKETFSITSLEVAGFLVEFLIQEPVLCDMLHPYDS